jgi:hypothetical protein
MQLAIYVVGAQQASTASPLSTPIDPRFVDRLIPQSGDRFGDDIVRLYWQ